ncbi:TPA: hypothetical protein ACJTQR_001977, partial [Streptococcus pyogenes]
HRMIFTASALVVERFGGNLEAIKDNGYEPFRNKIYDTLAKSLQDHRKQNLKGEGYNETEKPEKYAKFHYI